MGRTTSDILRIGYAAWRGVSKLPPRSLDTGETFARERDEEPATPDRSWDWLPAGMEREEARRLVFLYLDECDSPREVAHALDAIDALA